MWMILGTIAPTSLHVAQILHTIRHSLNAGTYCHTRRHGGPGSLHPAPPSRELPPLRSAFLAMTWCSAGVPGGVLTGYLNTGGTGTPVQIF
jgi:hypothetical protein